MESPGYLSHPMDSMKSYVANYVTLTTAEFDFFKSFFEVRTFKKKDILVQEGEVEKYLNFIDSGLARLFFLKGKEEVVLEFFLESEVICSYDSYLSGKPSNFTTEALEPLVVFSITMENLEKLFEFSPKIERLARLFTRQLYLKKANFDYNRVRVSTQERFLNFVEENGNMIQRIPQKYLASYLDMKPETFSRMKHLTRKKS